MRLRKEEKPMNYKKPEVAVLGEAVSVIQIVGKPGTPAESHRADPAYDLDE
jgi:hypothetical protein